ncbi:hypothetical protein NX86_08190, partial [Streptococcus phocae subsp. salmonis]
GKDGAPGKDGEPGKDGAPGIPTPQAPRNEDSTPRKDGDSVKEIKPRKDVNPKPSSEQKVSQNSSSNLINREVINQGNEKGSKTLPVTGDKMISGFFTTAALAILTSAGVVASLPKRKNF